MKTGKFNNNIHKYQQTEFSESLKDYDLLPSGGFKFGDACIMLRFQLFEQIKEAASVI